MHPVKFHSLCRRMRPGKEGPLYCANLTPNFTGELRFGSTCCDSLPRVLELQPPRRRMGQVAPLRTGRLSRRQGPGWPRDAAGAGAEDAAADFRDREEFSAGSTLVAQTVAVLEASQCLIVICSPNAAASKYVNEEIRCFKMLGRSDRIIPVIIDGEPGDPMRECFPPAVHLKLGANGQLSDDREELIAADARPQGDGRENVKLKVVAGLLGIGLDEILRRAERGRRQRLRNWIGALAVLALTLASLAVWAEINRRNAEVARQAAQEQRQQAERSEARAKAERDQALITQSQVSCRPQPPEFGRRRRRNKHASRHRGADQQSAGASLGIRPPL